MRLICHKCTNYFLLRNFFFTFFTLFIPYLSLIYPLSIPYLSLIYSSLAQACSLCPIQNSEFKIQNCFPPILLVGGMGERLKTIFFLLIQKYFLTFAAKFKIIRIMAKTANVLLGLAAGTAIGVGLGILFAPDKGKNTREKIKDSVSEKAEKLKEQLEKLTENVKEKSAELKGSVEEKVDALLSKSSYKAEDIITFLEKKLANLKEANAKLQK